MRSFLLLHIIQVYIKQNYTSTIIIFYTSNNSLSSCRILSRSLSWLQKKHYQVYVNFWVKSCIAATFAKIILNQTKLYWPCLFSSSYPWALTWLTWQIDANVWGMHQFYAKKYGKWGHKVATARETKSKDRVCSG